MINTISATIPGVNLLLTSFLKYPTILSMAMFYFILLPVVLLQEEEYQQRLELELRIKEEEIRSQYSKEIAELNRKLSAPSLQVCFS